MQIIHKKPYCQHILEKETQRNRINMFASSKYILILISYMILMGPRS